MCQVRGWPPHAILKNIYSSGYLPFWQKYPTLWGGSDAPPSTTHFLLSLAFGNSQLARATPPSCIHRKLEATINRNSTSEATFLTSKNWHDGFWPRIWQQSSSRGCSCKVNSTTLTLCPLCSPSLRCYCHCTTPK
jgi:hypothetical protein